MQIMNRLASEFKQNILQVAKALVPVTRGCFYEVGPDSEPRGHVVLGGETKWIKPYGETYRHYDPFHPRRFLHCRQSIITPGSLPREVPASSIYFREFMRPIGVAYKVEILLRDPANQIIAGLRLGRNAALGDFDAGMLEKLDAFRPVIEKACASAYAANPFPETPLSQREAQVFECLLEAMPDKLIARQLGVSLATVKLHVKSILRKLDVNSRAEAIVLAYRSRR